MERLNNNLQKQLQTENKLLYIEVPDNVGTKCIEASKEFVKAAKEEYAKTGKCKHKYIHDEPGFMYDLRHCGICGELLSFI